MNETLRVGPTMHPQLIDVLLRFRFHRIALTSDISKILSTKTLGFEWNTRSDHFHLTIASLPPIDCITKRALVSDIAKTFDALGWFAPTLIQAKILLQRLWERKVDWDQVVPDEIKDAWLQWRQELPLLASKQISRCYFPSDAQIRSVQIHGFCDASENAYAGVVYIRMIDSDSNVHISLVIAKTKVAPIKVTVYCYTHAQICVGVQCSQLVNLAMVTWRQF